MAVDNHGSNNLLPNEVIVKIQRHHSGVRRHANIGRLLALVAITASASTVARAEDQPPAPIVKFDVMAMGEPSPALRYRLLPPFQDLTPGNAAIVYTKIAIEFGSGQSNAAYEEYNKVADWMDLPADQLPRAEVEEVLRMHQRRLAEADRAARMESCDWQLPVRGDEPWAVLLPEAQGMRQVARLLVLRIRLEILDGKHDAAIHSLQTGFAMARHVAEQPTLVSGLVGMAIANLMMSEVAEFIRSPAAPNLYWALTTLPQPLVSLRLGMEQEQCWIDFAFPKLRDFDTAQYSADEWREQLVHVAAVSKNLLDDHPEQSVWPPEVLATAIALRAYPRAKSLMIVAGHPAEEVEKLPIAQVVLWGMMTDYRSVRDDVFKWYYVSQWERPAAQGTTDLLKSAEKGFEGYPFVWLIGAAQSAAWAEVRIERMVAAHTAVEALRIHASKHGHKLPAALKNVKEVPVPHDPSTGQPFAYSLSGTTGKLTSEAFNGKSPEHFGLHYEIKIIPFRASSPK
ncbi:MAG TPA: hypothetical protein VGN12_28460 [Pirellulales bacterium]|jgi:hypothetical protein